MIEGIIGLVIVMTCIVGLMAKSIFKSNNRVHP